MWSRFNTNYLFKGVTGGSNWIGKSFYRFHGKGLISYEFGNWYKMNGHENKLFFEVKVNCRLLRMRDTSLLSIDRLISIKFADNFRWSNNQKIWNEWNLEKKLSYKGAKIEIKLV